MIRQRESTNNIDPAGTGLEPVADRSMWWADTLRSGMRRSGLTGLKAVMNHTDGRCLRTLADRENWYLTLRDNKQETRGAFLKKHRVRTWRSRLRAALQMGPGETAGRVEARNVRRLTAEGIRVMHLLAYGEAINADGRLDSFLLTEALQGYEELDVFLRRRFGEDSQRPANDPANDAELNRLIAGVARIAARLHRGGYNHRDLYCCHFLVKEMAAGEFDIRLIDLQRVQHRRRWRGRWIVKDLAQLAYSAPRGRVACTRRMAFIKQYLGVRKLRGTDKRLIRRVLAKQHMMERKLGVQG